MSLQQGTALKEFCKLPEFPQEESSDSIPQLSISVPKDTDFSIGSPPQKWVFMEKPRLLNSNRKERNIESTFFTLLKDMNLGNINYHPVYLAEDKH